MHNNSALPLASWSIIEIALKKIAESEGYDRQHDAFLAALGLIASDEIPRLSPEGHAYYESKFLRNDKDKALALLQAAAISHPAVLATLQLLYGVRDGRRANVLSILKSHGMWVYKDERPLTNFLEFLNVCGAASYSRKHGTIKILSNPTESECLPPVMFIEPNRPFTNRNWLNKVLANARGHLRWIDKHFTSSGLECIAETIDASTVSRISIVSLKLPDLHGRNVVRDYRALKMELAAKGIEFTWYVVDSKVVRDIHDRWIIGDNGAWNLPDVNSILSGKRSEISSSPNSEAVRLAVDNYVDQADEIS